MKGMGYGNQPYCVIQHDDTGRRHYHIVSVRVDENGWCVTRGFERYRSMKVLSDLCLKYQINIGKQETITVALEKAGKETNDMRSMVFDLKKGNVREQMLKIAADAYKYKFSSTYQFQLLMESRGVEVCKDTSEGRNSLIFYGLDTQTGERNTEAVYAESLNTRSVPRNVDEIVDRAKKVLQYRRALIFERPGDICAERIQCLYDDVSRDSSCNHEIVNKLADKGIILSYGINKSGQIFGTTLMDLTTRNCYMDSELNIYLSVFNERRPEQVKLRPQTDEETGKERNQGMKGENVKEPLQGTRIHGHGDESESGGLTPRVKAKEAHESTSSATAGNVVEPVPGNVRHMNTFMAAADFMKEMLDLGQDFSDSQKLMEDLERWQRMGYRLTPQ